MNANILVVMNGIALCECLLKVIGPLVVVSNNWRLPVIVKTID